VRQIIWDIGAGSTTLEWPDEEVLPGKACQQIGYHQEAMVGNESLSLALFQWPQSGLDEHVRLANKPRYLLVLTMEVGYEIIGARDLKGLLQALSSLTPLANFTQTSLIKHESSSR
jgi:hypothetical protein